MRCELSMADEGLGDQHGVPDGVSRWVRWEEATAVHLISRDVGDRDQRAWRSFTPHIHCREQGGGDGSWTPS